MTEWGGKPPKLVSMNNFKKLAELVDFLRVSKVKMDANPHDALCSMQYSFDNSDGEKVILDGDDILFELPILIKFSELEVDQCIELDDEEKEVCFESLSRVSQFLSACTSNMNWINVKNKHLTTEMIMSLKLAASAIKASGIKNVIEKDFAIKCANDLVDIRNNIIQSTIPEPLKSHLISNLTRLIHIFDTIDAYGAQDAQDKMKVLIADVFLSATSIPKSEQPKLKPLLSKLGLILAKFRNSVGNVRAIEYVAETYDKIL